MNSGNGLVFDAAKSSKFDWLSAIYLKATLKIVLEVIHMSFRNYTRVPGSTMSQDPVSVLLAAIYLAALAH